MRGGCLCCRAIPECPNGTILPPFEVSVSWDADADLDLYVLEPGGVEVFYGQKLGVSYRAGNGRGTSKTGIVPLALAAGLLQSTYRARVHGNNLAVCE